MEIKYKLIWRQELLVLFSSYMHNSCAASDRAEDYSATYGITSRTIPCAIGKFYGLYGCGFIDPELDIKKDTENIRS